MRNKLGIQSKILLARNYVLWLLFQFDRWHIAPLAAKPYALDVVNYINHKKNKNLFVVDVGCGLGHILCDIDCLKRIGLDTSESVIRAARFRSSISNATFKVGSFSQLNGEKIDYLIALNFMHVIPDSTLILEFEALLKRNVIKYILVDRVIGYPDVYDHNFDLIIGPKFKLIETFDKNYSYGRKVLIYESVN